MCWCNVHRDLFSNSNGVNKDVYSDGCDNNDGNNGGGWTIFFKVYKCLLLRQFLRREKKRWRNASDADGVLFYFSDVERFAAASGVNNKYGYIVGCSDNDGDGGGCVRYFF